MERACRRAVADQPQTHGPALETLLVIVAIVVPVGEYQRLRGGHAKFKDAYQRFLTTHDLTKVGVDRKFSGTLRDRTIGSRVRL